MVVRFVSVLLVLMLAGCGSVPMFVDMGNNKIIRGVAKGRIGSTATFTASDSSSNLTCTGTFPFSTDRVVNGTMSCNNGQTGKYLMNMSNGPKWRGEGSLDNGQTFRIFINYTTDPDKR